MDQHKKYMRRCIDLARLGAGNVSPNPMVGAVIVADDKIIGEGYHKKYGGPHAEVNAINNAIAKNANAGELFKTATIYVSLEPCAHYGKTPPCADLIIKHQIPGVVIGCRDPFEQVNGKGVEKLQAASVHVTSGVLEKECLWLNRRFFTSVIKHRPYVILKWAQTSDGYFAPNDKSQFWITGIQAKKLVHKWRTQDDTVLVGKNTAAIDNPQLNARHWHGKAPARVVIDRHLTLDKSLNIFDAPGKTFVFNQIKTDVEDNITYIQLEDFDNYVPQYIMYQLYLQDIRSVIIEGGAYTLNNFIEANLWDEARIFTGNKTLNGGIKVPDIKLNKNINYNIGDDTFEIVYNPTLQ